MKIGQINGLNTQFTYNQSRTTNLKNQPNHLAFKSAAALSPKQVDTISQVVNLGNIGKTLNLEKFKKDLAGAISSLPDNLSKMLSNLLDEYSRLMNKDDLGQFPPRINPHFRNNIYEAAMDSQNRFVMGINKSLDFEDAVKAAQINDEDKRVLTTIASAAKKGMAQKTLSENEANLLGSIQHYDMDEGEIKASINFVKRILGKN